MEAEVRGDVLTVRSIDKSTRVLALLAMVTCALHAAAVFAATDFASLDCVRHATESNSSYHAHEDSDCMLINNLGAVDFELSDASTRRGLTRGLLLRSRVDVVTLVSKEGTYDLVVRPKNQAQSVRLLARVREFLDKAHKDAHEKVELHLSISRWDAASLLTQAFLTITAVVGGCWPIRRVSRLDARRRLFVFDRSNLFGYSLPYTKTLRSLEQLSSASVDDSATTISLSGPRLRALASKKAGRVVLKFDEDETPLEITADSHDVSGLRAACKTINRFVALLDTSANNTDKCCVVCLTKRPNTALMPCRHACVCSFCAKRVSKCPVCRCEVEDRISLFVV